MIKEIILMCLKYLIINIMIYVVDFKIINEDLKNKKTIVKIVISSVLTSIIYVIVKKLTNNNVFPIISSYIFQILLMRLYIYEICENIITINLLSNAIVYFLFGCGVIVDFIPHTILKINSNFINLAFILMMESILIYLVFKPKRLKKGIYSINKKTKDFYVDIIIINISALVILIYLLFGNFYGNITIYIWCSLILISIIMIIMIYKTIALAYKQKQLEKNLAEDDEIIKQKDAKIESLSKEKFEISKVSHEFEKRIKALEFKATSNMNMEVSEENDLMKQINNLSKEYSTKLKQIKGSDKLKKTEVAEIDNMFEYLQNECEKSNIEFYLNINCDVNNMINKVIAKNKLETLIGDLGTDAIHAVNMSKNNYKSIVTIIDKQENIYLISMSDTGVEFKVDTLLKLGLEPATTHKEDGGSGIGYITTFETLNETKASLIIEEKNNESENEYTKTITVKFDGRNEYKIISYRADEIRKKQKDSRIKVENIKNSDNI